MSPFENNLDSATNSQLDHAATQRLNHLETVNKLSTALRVAMTIDEMLPILANETRAVIEGSAVTVWLYDRLRSELQQVAASGFPNMNIRLKPGEGIAGQVFLSGVAHVSREFKTDPRTYESARDRVPAGLAGAAVPIRAAQTVIGVLFVSVQLPRQLSDDQVQLLATIAEIAGIAIHRLHLHLQTERRLQRLSALRVVDMAIHARLDQNVVLNIILDQTISQLRVDAACIVLFDEHTQRFTFAAGRGFTSRAIEQKRVASEEELAARAAMERQTIRVPVLAEASPAFATLLAAEKFIAYFAIPLVAHGRVNGVLEIFQRAALNPEQEWIDFVEMLATQAALALENATRLNELGRPSTDLEFAFDAVIDAWAHALDARDGDPAGYSARVAEETVRLARARGVAEKDLPQIRRGALLHDIGMMRVPDHIRLKQGALTDKEWEIVRQHPVDAYELLSGIGYLRAAMDIPYCHHEKWDGTGYPSGLRGERIPLAARIFAVVDVYFALRADRPHRPGLSERNALQRIQSLAGSHFDPRIVEQFIKLELAAP